MVVFGLCLVVVFVFMFYFVFFFVSVCVRVCFSGGFCGLTTVLSVLSLSLSDSSGHEHH